MRPTFTTSTMGNLRPPSSTHQITQRPPPPTLEGMGGLRFSMPPLPQVSDLMAMTAPQLPLVEQALILAADLDLKQDQSYMPMEHTTLAEAYTHLRQRNYILIQGGRIDHTHGVYRLALRGRGIPQFITKEDVGELLACNYPETDAVEVKMETEEGESIPPGPMPTLGAVGLSAHLPYGLDIDDIAEDAWHPFCFAQGATQQLLYMGDIILDTKPARVWYSLHLSCYICQFITSETL